ncbi:hypothetical protein EMCRGX_G012989 [Ephydatia muelleri]
MMEESVAALMRMLLEDRKARDEQYERQQAKGRELMERQQEWDELEKNQMRKQMEMLRKVTEESRRPEESRTRPMEGEAKFVKLTEQDDIESYLTTFERIMRACEVKEERWTMKIAPQLTGKAQQARRPRMLATINWQQFRDAVMKKDETLSKFNVHLTDLFLERIKGCKTVEQLRDLMILEQLVNALQTEVRMWVTERKPMTSAEAAKLADDYLSARKQNGSRLGQERKFNQKAAVDGKKKTVSESSSKQESEPKGDDAPRTAVGKRSFKREIRCFNCHKARDCPSNALFGGEQGMLGIKHSGVVEGNAVDDIMLETGCSRTMVRGDLVPREKILESRGAVVRCAHGNTVLYPTAQVCLEVDGYKINTTAAVTNTLLMAVLLGTNVPELLTRLNCRTLRGNVETSEAFVMMQAASRRRAEEEREQARRERSSGVQPKPVLAEQPKESWDLGPELDEAIFQGGRQRPTQAKSQKRQKRIKGCVLSCRRYWVEHFRQEVPQSSTGFSPFELLYGREVKGPLDIVKETWEASEWSNQSVVSYVVSIREKLGKMAALVRENLEKAQQAQKAWYNHNAHQRGFKKGDSVLVLLHTSNNPLLARWQGPYKVVKPVGTASQSAKEGEGTVPEGKQAEGEVKKETMSEEITKKKHIRAGHKASAARIIVEVKEGLATTECNVSRLDQQRQKLKMQYDDLRKLDSDILGSLESEDDI